MEDVKERPRENIYIYSIHWVSILVLMEDVKEQEAQVKANLATMCFNPCFNGRMEKQF